VSTDLIIPQRAATPTPGEVTAYLRATGWFASVVNERWAEYRRQLDDGDAVVEVPQRAQAPDYARVVLRVLDYLAELERRPVATVHQDIRSIATDRVRLRLEGPGIVAGRLSVEAGWQVYEAARDLLLAAACAAHRTAAVFPRRKPGESMAVLDHARFGLAEVGSFVLNIESDVAPALQQPLVDATNDPSAPAERKATIQLARALHAAQAATHDAIARGELTSFKHSVASGVSANLCDAIADMITASDATSLDASVTFATRRPVATELQQRASFTAEARDVLRAAAKELRQETSYYGIEVAGLVRRLESGNVAKRGVVVLHGVVDGRARPVRVDLAPSDYQIAVTAHGQGQMVECVGDLERQGRSWVLLNHRHFRIIEDPEDP